MIALPIISRTVIIYAVATEIGSCLTAGSVLHNAELTGLVVLFDQAEQAKELEF